MTHCLSCWWRDLSNIQNRSHYARTYCWRVQHLSISVSSKHKIRTTVVVAYDIVVNIKWGIVKSREYLLQMPGASCRWTPFYISFRGCLPGERSFLFSAGYYLVSPWISTCHHFWTDRSDTQRLDLVSEWSVPKGSFRFSSTDIFQPEFSHAWWATKKSRACRDAFNISEQRIKIFFYRVHTVNLFFLS